jgi:hypothetical protein
MNPQESFGAPCTISPGAILLWGAGLAVAGCAVRCEREAAPPFRSATSALEASRTTAEANSSSGPSVPAVHSPIRFEWLQDCGIDFTYYGNPSPEHYMTEQNGGGVAIFDYDRNGWLDVFLTNGSHFDRPANDISACHQLFRGQAVPDGSLHFEAAGEKSRLSVSGFGMGAVAGDYDNDGFPDLVVCCYGDVRLWQNNGDGTFADVTAESSITGDEWATSAAFADLDEDGDLDLYVANYVVYSPTDPPCFLDMTGGQRIPISCGPIGRTAQADRLWENLGDGMFRDVSPESGIRAIPPGKGLAVEIVDLTGDDLLDIYVANDTSNNLLFENRGGLKFEEVGLSRGVAVGQRGTPESSMGIACADFDGNGRFDLFVTNFENAVNDFYLNLSDTGFLHDSAGYGLDLPSRPMLAFATIASDFDLDGWPDLFVANGHIWDLTAGQDKHQFEMPPQLFWNRMGRRFDDVSSFSGAYFTERWLARSAAAGDLDNDGAADLVVSHLKRPAAVLKNASDFRGRSLVVELIGRTAAREPLGIRVTAIIAGEQRQYHVPAGGSYQASSDPRVIVTTGEAATEVALTVHWSRGDAETWSGLPVQGRIQLIQGDFPNYQLLR